ncbi:SDR family NAD(P)-dependent oxidoreductase [Roseivirga sp. E12]|uniref:SDR family NAD(P)-dependent oxidoreductase n=1 Tax=Roseivirga sp. E12 TaxID=2819237 RepID=UPI001B2A7DA0|nr:SDR family oxidoreductase [Roseivirga sp. E12]MBO3699763.1 SDR family oxidoreductase [Roseivirga sp. E12]
MVVLITGTSRGIGRYLVEYYCSKGNKVIGCSRNDSIFSADNYQHIQLDVSDEPAVQNMFRSIRKEYNQLDVLINNAAVNLTLSPVYALTKDSVLRTMEVNFVSTVLMSKMAVKLMSKNTFGRIINIGSMASKLEVKGESIYSASKAAINTFTRVMAKEVHRLGITCNVVAPSAIETELSKQIDPEALKEVLSRNAVSEFGRFEDISNTIDFLLSQESNAVTGQIIYLGGV